MLGGFDEPNYVTPIPIRVPDIGLDPDNSEEHIMENIKSMAYKRAQKEYRMKKQFLSNEARNRAKHILADKEYDSKAVWSLEEIEILIKRYKIFGNKWSMIASCLDYQTKRTAEECKFCWEKLKRLNQV